MRLNKRERNLTIATVTVVAVGLLVNFVAGGGASFSLGGGEPAQARAQFRDDYQKYREGNKIRSQYRQFDVWVSERVGDQRPNQIFTNDLNKMLTEQFKIKTPKIGTPTYVEIKEVPDYCFVELEVKIDGMLGELMRLLTNMEKQGFMIKSFTLAQSRRQLRAIELTVTVAGLVKVDEEIKRILQRGWG